ncbi:MULTISPECIES: DUF3080 family protein [unclassified Halomonas]|uniref:DUF3080 family protein n=1 Tax=unclassified Halomonas TaxID=2609666 RepID=UPI0007F123F6|nr:MULTISPECIES: DUF3080 family protein [unclassified Halomonas]SBR47842.1 Protein of unknown function (DUF3080) [Halomonas sp. HL-93]SNY95632.1 Protein of unknown function [Halomonas sp. hl-4]
MKRYFRVLAQWLLPLTLLGCGDKHQAEEPWSAYYQQLENALDDGSIERQSPPNIGEFPARKARLFDIDETRDSLLNIYALRECDITSLVAARNNQLGKVAPPSQQWLYERTLWQRLTLCWTSNVPKELSEESRERLRRLTGTKTSQLPYVSWNALFDSDEWIASFARASHPLKIGAMPDIESQLDAVHYLQQMVEHQFSLAWHQDSSRLEQHLNTLRARPLTAEILRTLMLATQRLNDASEYLNQYAAPNETCLPMWDQQRLTTFSHSAKRWLTAVNNLINRHPIVAPEALQAYQSTWLSLAARNSPWQQFQAAIDTHDRARSRFAHCATD